MNIVSGTSRHKLIKAGAGATFAIVATLGTLNVAAAKYNPSASYPIKVGIVIARLLGPDVANQIIKPLGVGGIAGVSQGVALMGPFNTTTYGGIGLLIANFVIKWALGGKFGYSTYAAPFLTAAGGGMIFAGIVGGLLDPPGPGGDSSFLSRNPVMPLSASSSQPYLSATAVRLHGR